MNRIEAFSGISSVAPAAGRTVTQDSNSNFASILAQMKANGAAKSHGSGDGDSEEKISKLRYLADGSLVVQVIQGNDLLAQTKVGNPPSAPAQTLQLMPDGTMQLVDRYNDTSLSSVFSAGALFSGVA